MAETKHVRIGVFVPSGAQLLDTAAVDVLATMGRDYLGLVPTLPPQVTELAPKVSVTYISLPGDKTIPLTAGMVVNATHDASHPDVQPGKLDILMIPGPDPNGTWPEEVLAFLRAHDQCETTDILCICTASALCGAAGILDGKTVCGPKGFQKQLKEKFPKANFVGHKYRWWQDGNFWSCGGVTNGNDLAAAYARSGKHFPLPVAELVCQLVDVGDRQHEY